MQIRLDLRIKAVPIEDKWLRSLVWIHILIDSQRRDDRQTERQSESSVTPSTIIAFLKKLS